MCSSLTAGTVVSELLPQFFLHAHVLKLFHTLQIFVDSSEGGPDNYLTTFCCPTPQTSVQSCITCKVRGGLITTEDVNRIFTKLRQVVLDNSGMAHSVCRPLSTLCRQYGFCQSWLYLSLCMLSGEGNETDFHAMSSETSAALAELKLLRRNKNSVLKYKQSSYNQ